MGDYKGIYTVTNSKDDFIKISEHHLLDRQREHLWDDRDALKYISDGSYALFSASVVNNKLTVQNYVDSDEEEVLGWIDTTYVTRVTPTEFLEALNEPGLE